jgi:S-adenosylmethionine:tRNA ribosyltransferase-isomerase
MTLVGELTNAPRRDKLHAGASLDFGLPSELEAGEPPEQRGVARDAVRLMVSDAASDRFVHTSFDRIGNFLEPGDLFVINTSGTMNAALDAEREDGTALELRLSTLHPDGDGWIVELRRQTPDGATQFRDVIVGETLRLARGGAAALVEPVSRSEEGTRLWRARLILPLDIGEYLREHGRQIRYSYVHQPWPAVYYQNAYSLEPRSAEMPSAGRGFTEALITRLVARGVQFAPIELDTGVSSLDDDEAPYPERYDVPGPSARAINAARSAGSRVIAVGTTAVRAVETVTDECGVVRTGAGWTDLVIAPERRVWIDGLLTGFHAPRASHLAMLEAIAGRRHLDLAYAEALRHRYLWHEFGDAHLIIRQGTPAHYDPDPR